MHIKEGGLIFQSSPKIAKCALIFFQVQMVSLASGRALNTFISVLKIYGSFLEENDISPTFGANFYHVCLQLKVVHIAHAYRKL